ncbi:hypothetical protein SAPIO_CDS8960 [Scedosporium apiospermum]|uniref:Glutamine amidotransferase type-2 domain-containing protein n=1 Tax=Pseudallescheria apiosperma TaxID=563466 RepID=A0A084FY20_PSEDA|nr:uncharacterized protein SAPIO_CDS8960 [Scedosporium apiospermum]KEZ39982.1 hypothetical protein SAPIO_CDS8960 [Scedosporium apiospermum]
MCGIYASISRRDGLVPSSALQSRLVKRGPDHLGTTRVSVKSGEDSQVAEIFLTFQATVLSLRGRGITEQPLVRATSGAILCWNGEAWTLGGKTIAENDGAAVLSTLDAASGEDAVLDVLQSINGPFAFIYYDPRDGGRIYFGRDRLGRRSLLVHDGEDFILSSVADPGLSGWVEVEADGVYSLDVARLGDARSGSVTMPMVKRHVWLPEDLGEYSLSLRVLNIPQPPRVPAVSDYEVDTRVAVLFSGGLDCTVLARLASELLPPEQGIDLINVAFENPRIAARLQPAEDDEFAIYEACPDRITGRKSFQELRDCCPGRRWRFIASHRSEVVALMHPHNTEMDLSIAYALYFAARGIGIDHTDPETPSSARLVSTPARVLLSGLGADELFGGYVRHATAFARKGYHGLLEELKLDVGRLGKRNLGRDDRVMSHWGREIRFPFLDEQLVKWAVEAPVWEKCDFAVPGKESVEADKRVLRLLAAQLGMKSVAREKKRAIQFGSRTAKMENGKTKGTHLISG